MPGLSPDNEQGRMRMARSQGFFAGMGMAIALMLGFEPVWADPPDWAPAHGYRDHRDHEDEDHHHKRHHHKKHRHDDDYDWNRSDSRDEQRRITRIVVDNRCQYERVGRVVGTVVGGAVGAHMAHERDRPAAIFFGALLGYSLGDKLFDSADRICIAQTLEFIDENLRVTWTNQQRNAYYTVTPQRRYREGGRYCREFTSVARIGDRKETVFGTACRQPDGAWQIQG